MPRMMVVEDEATTALFFSFILKKAGHTVCGKVSSGEEALKVLQNTDLPDLILMDLGLAGKMDGVLTARAIREMGPVPLLFISGYDDEQTHARLKEFDHAAYLTKPVRPELLLQKIEELLLNRPGNVSL